MGNYFFITEQKSMTGPIHNCDHSRTNGWKNQPPISERLRGWGKIRWALEYYLTWQNIWEPRKSPNTKTNLVNLTNNSPYHIPEFLQRNSTVERVWKSNIAYFHNNWILMPLNSKANQICLEWQHKSLSVPILKRSKRYLQRKLGFELFADELI